MRRICNRCPSAFRPTAVHGLPRRSISIAIPRYANEGTSPKAKALEVYQVPKSNVPGRTLLTQPSPGIREQPRWLLSIAMKLFRSSVMRKATQGSTAKAAMKEYYALCATRATSDGDETSTGFWYDGTLTNAEGQLTIRTWITAEFRYLVSSHCLTRIHAPYTTPMLPS